MSNLRCFVGIDPGASGGIAVIHPDGKVECCKMPDTERDVWGVLKDIGIISAGQAVAIIEKVGGYIGKNQPASRAFKFGQSYGGLRMALIAAEITFDEIAPQTWQKGVGVISKKDEGKTEHKNRLKAKAQQLFPKQKITLATADALLLAWYCKKTF